MFAYMEDLVLPEGLTLRPPDPPFDDHLPPTTNKQVWKQVEREFKLLKEALSVFVLLIQIWYLILLWFSLQHFHFLF